MQQHTTWQMWMTFIMAKSLAQSYYQWNKSWVACLLCGKCEAQWMCQVQCFSGAYYWWRWSGRDQGCPDTWWAGQSCAWLAFLEKTLQLWRNPVTGLSSILLKSLSCMTVMKKLPKWQKAKITLEFVHSGVSRTFWFRNRRYKNKTKIQLLQSIYMRTLIILLEI